MTDYGDEDRVRAVLERESLARLALKRAKAEEFLRCVRSGIKQTEAWQQVVLATARLEDEYEEAAVEKLVLWYRAGWNLPSGISANDQE